jgi:hypothetical protein
MAAPARESRQVAREEETREMRRPADPGRGPRWVLWTGMMLGTAVLVLAWRHGMRLRLPLQPALLAGFGGFLAEALALIGLSIWSAHLVRRHHRTMIRYTARKTRQHTASAIRGARGGGGAIAAAASGWAAPRWQGRGESWRAPLLITRHPAATGSEDGSGEPGGTAITGAPAVIAPPAASDTATTPDPAGAPAHAVTSQNGERPTMTKPAAPDGGTIVPPFGDITDPDYRARMRERGGGAPRAGAPAPGGWDALVSDTHDFEADDDGELLEWMADQTAGMLRYGEAIADVHEHHVSDAVRLDPAAMAMLHDAADAVADAAEAMARAAEKFREVYEAPRGFVADGGVLPKDGDFLTGDDE